MKADAIFGYAVSHFLSSTIWVGRDEYSVDNSKKSEVLAKYSSPSNTSNIFATKERSYEIFSMGKLWYIAYKASTANIPTLPVAELLQPLLCEYCGEEIDKNLFVANCRYKHKYHGDCIQSVLSKRYHNEIFKLVEGIDNYKKPRPTCYACESPLNLKKLTEVFNDYFTTEYLDDLDKQPVNRLQVYSKDMLKSDLTLSLEDLAANSPFKEPKEGAAFELVVKSKPECFIKQDEFLKFTKGPSCIWYDKFCAKCGNNCEKSKKFLLSCNHSYCVACALPCFASTDVNKEEFKNNGKDVEGITFPIGICRFCERKGDLVGVQLHDEHYISLPVLLWKCFLNNGALDKCIVDDYKIDASEILREILDPSKPSSLLASKDIGKDVKVTNSVKQWMRDRYCVIRVEGEKSFLTGCKNRIHLAEADLKKVPEIEKQVESFQSSFIEFSKSNSNWSNNLMKIRGFELLKYKEFSKAANPSYIGLRIHSTLYNYKLSDDIYFMPIQNNLTALSELFIKSKDLNEQHMQLVKESCLMAGGFGCGYYLSQDPSITHRIAVVNNCVRYIAAVRVARPLNKHKKVKVCSNDCRRLTGVLHFAEDEESKENYFEEGMSGVLQGDVLTISRVKREAAYVEQFVVVFEPALIVPISIIAYGINFTKL
eukprot:TRINITY_DN8092_c0_g1_i13.p1 TRINITY_DN8092_c0_g1~~TRINITY_DN8092_c0_g1_i13.p1  ORF type:complete len:653 (+),score=113.01 TRINITY_DN8092_c0_g1_i13:385-2343(+)